jgi:hypothetical protein
MLADAIASDGQNTLKLQRKQFSLADYGGKYATAEQIF